MKRFAVVLAILVIAFSFGCEKEAAHVAEGEMAPDFTLTDLNGQPFHLSDFRGKVVVVEFWATWCPPCIASIPEMNEIETEYKDKDFAMIGVSLDDDIDILKDFYKENGLLYRVAIDDQHLDTEYGIFSIPTAVVIDREGKVVARHMGYAPGTLKDTIAKTMRGEPIN